jgi:hypothetical protein
MSKAELIVHDMHKPELSMLVQLTIFEHVALPDVTLATKYPVEQFVHPLSVSFWLHVCELPTVRTSITIKAVAQLVCAPRPILPKL